MTPAAKESLRVQRLEVVVGAISIVMIGAVGVAYLAHLANSASKSPPCIITPAPVSIAEAKLQLSFPVYTLAGDPDSSLISSYDVQSCSGTRSLDLHYRLGSRLFELVETAAPPPGSPLVYLKGGATAQTGWSTMTIEGNQFEVDTTAGGKGLPAGIEMAVWANSTTMFTLTPQSETPGGRPTPLSTLTLEEIATRLAPA